MTHEILLLSFLIFFFKQKFVLATMEMAGDKQRPTTKTKNILQCSKECCFFLMGIEMCDNLIFALFSQSAFFPSLLFPHFFISMSVSLSEFSPIQCTQPDNISNILTCNFKHFWELDGRLHHKNAFQKREKYNPYVLFRAFSLFLIRHILLGVSYLVCTLYNILNYF